MSHPAESGYAVGPVVEVTPGHYKRPIAPGAEWTARAASWPLTVVARETEAGHWLTDVVPAEPIPPLTQLHLCCAECDGFPSVFCLSPDVTKLSYQVTSADMLSGIIRHLRQSHEQGVASS